MFDLNSGYVGSSRSVRSEEAIDNFEMPLSMINRGSIDDLIDTYPEYQPLAKLSVSLWKFSAKRQGPSSWHHTGKFFNETNHYNLFETADYLLAHADQVQQELDKAKRDAKAQKEAQSFNQRIYYLGLTRV